MKGLKFRQQIQALIVKHALRLPEKLLERLFISVAEKLQQKVMVEQLWCGRHIKVIDGSTVSMPDPIENQKLYPIAV